MLKKIAIVFGVLVVLIVGALAALPLFVSVDQLKPKIEAAAKESLRGELTIAKLSLRGFPSVRLSAEGIVAKAPAPWDKQSPLAKIEAIEVDVPIWSLLFSPRATIRLRRPEIHMESKGPASNLAAFLPPPSGKPLSIPSIGDAVGAMPAIIGARLLSARFYFEVVDGSAVTESIGPEGKSKITASKLEVDMTNIGLSTPIGLKASVDVDMASSGMTIKGPVSVDGTIQITPQGGTNIVKISATKNLNGLDIRMAPLFHKPAGTAFQIAVDGTLTQAGGNISADFPKFELQFGQLKALASAKAENVMDEKLARIEFALNAPNVDIASFGAFVPMVRDYGLGGTVVLRAEAKGALAAPVLDAQVDLKNIKGETPAVKAPISGLNGRIRVGGTAKAPHIVIDPFSMRLASSDLALKIDVNGLSPMNVKVDVNSKRINVDELLGIQPFKVGAGGGATSSDGGGGKAAPSAAAGQPLDESLNAMAPTVEEALKNPALDTLSATIALKVGSLQALGAEYRDASFNLSLAKRKVTIAKTGIKAYGGGLTLDGGLNLDPKAMGYAVNAALKQISVQEVTKAHAPAWQKEITGTINGDFRVAGAGLRKEQIAKSLSGGLKGEIRDGRISIPVVKLLSTVLSSVPGVAKLPQNGGETFNGEFKTAKIVSTIQGRVVKLDDLDVIFATQKIGLGDLEFKAGGTVNFDRQVDITGTAFLSPEVVRIPELKGPSGRIEIPLAMKGDMSDPKADVAYTVKILGPRVAQAVLKKQAGAAVSKEVDKLQQGLPPASKKAVDDLRKKFGF